MTDSIQHDVIHRFTLANDQLRGEIVTLKHTYQDAVAHQTLPEPILLLLGEFFAATALLAEVLKFEGTLTLQVRGDGLVPLIMAEATSERTLRGVAKVSEHVRVEDLNGAGFEQMVGQGVLTLTIDPVAGKRYQGIVPVDGGSLASCISHYFCQSEQLPTQVWLSSSKEIVGGLFLQQLPQKEDEENTPELWNTAQQLAATVKHEELEELPHATVLYRLFHELEVKLFPPHTVNFACTCSKERSGNALVSLGKAEVDSILLERGNVEMDCHFCGAHYQFNQIDVQKLFGEYSTRH